MGGCCHKIEECPAARGVKCPKGLRVNQKVLRGVLIDWAWPKNTPKTLFGAFFYGPLNTPVNGGWGCKNDPKTSSTNFLPARSLQSVNSQNPCHFCKTDCQKSLDRRLATFMVVSILILFVPLNGRNVERINIL